MPDGQTYNAPPGTPSDIGPQFRTDYYNKKALIEATRDQFFSPLADVASMPKNMGKTIKRYHYMPLLDDRNVNDQGLDAAGATLANGNLYGSSKDIGTIVGKLPTLSETGGRVNRVGFKRIELTGSINDYGIFDEYSQESLDFDTDEQLEMHIRREMITGANEINEDMIQMDLLNGAGTLRYAGTATSRATVTGEGGSISVVDYNDLMRLSIDLDNNRTPKFTTIIKGSRMQDTRVIDAARVMFIGSELLPTIKKMTDNFGKQAFIPVQQYADAGNVLNGEVGTIDQFRIVVAPEMQSWTSAGATETAANTGYRATASKYDVFPMLVVGNESFTTIGFQTDGKSVKFNVHHTKPGSDNSYSAANPYGKLGFMSINWYYGTLLLRPERIAVLNTVAEL